MTIPHKWSHVVVRAGWYRRQRVEELMSSNYGTGEDSWESFGQQGYQNMSILREINPEYSLEGLMLKLKLQYFVIWCKELTHWNVPDAGKDWGQKEKSASEDEMAGWHHRCDGHELGQTSGDGEGQRGLVCHIPWGQKESDTTGWLDNNNNDKPTANIIFKDEKNFFPVRSKQEKDANSHYFYSP